jgi:hypothetical protein
MALEIPDATENWRRLGHEIGFGIAIADGFATPSGLKDASIMPPSARSPTWPLAFAMKPSQDKS